MMKRIFLSIACAMVVPVLSQAQTEKSSLPDWLDLGADIRLRDEYSRANQSLDPNVAGSEQNALRARMRGWFQLKSRGEIPLRLNMRMTYEPRYWTKGRKELGRRKTEWRYSIPDILNISAEKIFGLPLTVTLGRQELNQGGNNVAWLWGDGTATDGSYTTFFDALRAVYAKDGLTAELVLIDQHADASRPSFRIGHQTSILSEQNERGVILSLFNKVSENTKVGGFFVHKHDERVQNLGYNGNSYTIGGHVSSIRAKGLGFQLEAAYQFGHREDLAHGFRNRDISAYALNGDLHYEFGDARKNKLSFIMEYFSADDPSGSKDGMFDVLWGRYTRWTDVVGSTFVPETGRNFQYSNLHRLCVEWGITPMKDTRFTLNYSALFAPEKTPTRVASVDTRFSRDGHFRGHVVRAMVSRQFTRQIKGHIVGEAMFQGNYYRDRHCLSFVRVELDYRW